MAHAAAMPTATTSRQFTSVAEYLTWDHDELDAMFADIVPMVEDAEWERASEHFDDFRRRLERHIAIEEEILFPVFERRVAPHGPTDVMREDHRQIKDALATIGGALQSADTAAFDRGRATLIDVLANHNLREERVLYPTVERAAADEMPAVLERALSY